MQWYSFRNYIPSYIPKNLHKFITNIHINTKKRNLSAFKWKKKVVIQEFCCFPKTSISNVWTDNLRLKLRPCLDFPSHQWTDVCLSVWSLVLLCLAKLHYHWLVVCHVKLQTYFSVPRCWNSLVLLQFLVVGVRHCVSHHSIDLMSSGSCIRTSHFSSLR